MLSWVYPYPWQSYPYPTRPQTPTILKWFSSFRCSVGPTRDCCCCLQICDESLNEKFLFYVMYISMLNDYSCEIILCDIFLFLMQSLSRVLIHEWMLHISWNDAMHTGTDKCNADSMTIFTASRKDSRLAIFTAKKNKDAALSLRTIYPTQAPCFTPWSR